MAHEFLVINGCPCPKNIAPYIAICLKDARASAVSIYRGDDARAILNAHGHHSQKQIYDANAAQRAAWGIEGQPDRPGTSTHELKSDGVAYPGVALGHDLPWWGEGFDVPNAHVTRVEKAASSHSWQLFRPYGSGVEYHHLNFRVAPKPHSLRMRLRILRVRRQLPKH